MQNSEKVTWRKTDQDQVAFIKHLLGADTILGVSKYLIKSTILALCSLLD